MGVHCITEGFALNGEGGELVTMTDSSAWFHPYSGGKPVQVIFTDEQEAERFAAMRERTAPIDGRHTDAWYDTSAELE